MKVLVTGGVRSGKSVHAEGLLLGEPRVTYIAPGPEADLDPEWAERVAAHQLRRPAHWATIETADLAGGIGQADGAVMVDCLGTWLASTIDELDGWEEARADWEPELLTRLDAAVLSMTDHAGPVVVVTNEVGMGVVPEHRSDRIFRDLLGTVNQRVAAACDDVLLVIAGRVLTL